MPYVLLGSTAYVKNDPQLVTWFWTGRNYKPLLGVALDVPGWGECYQWAESPAGTLESGPVKLLQECVAPVRPQVFGSGQAPHALSTHLFSFNTGVWLLCGQPQGPQEKRSRCCWQGDKLCFLPRFLLSRLALRGLWCQ